MQFGKAGLNKQCKKLRTRADVPLSLCLSGGVDSSVLLAISEKILGKKLKCYSIIDNDSRYMMKEKILKKF